ncbi:hypothetical protein ACFLSA_01130 [Bacteroidota bacterium]
MINPIYFKISDFNFELKATNQKAKIKLNEFLEPFRIKQPGQVDLSILVRHERQIELIDYTIMFRAEIIHSIDGKLIDWFIASNQYGKLMGVKERNRDIPYVMMYFNEDVQSWDLLINDTADIQDPLKYPAGILMLYYFLLFHKTILLHSSGIFYQNRGMVFSACSGTGKTTMAKLWMKKGGILINDDRLIIRRIDGVYYMYNSPMLYPVQPIKARVDFVFLLRQSNENYFFQVNGSEAVTRLFLSIIQHNYIKELVLKKMEIVRQLCADIPVYELGFLPDESIIDFILNGNF